MATMTRRAALAGMAGALTGLFIKPAPRRLDLAPFCDRVGSRYDTRTPYHVNDWTYATDCKVCVRVRPLAADVGTHTGEVPPFPRLPWDHDTLRGWTPAPKLEPILVRDANCPACDGYGCVTGVGVECEKCQGVGSVYTSGWQTSAADCPDCQGRGHTLPGPACPVCKGNAIGTFPAVVKLGDHYLDARRYELVRATGADVAFAPYALRSGDPAPLMRFRAEGGDGLLMPLDPRAVEHRAVKGVA